jgi:hypothetical protein
VKNAGFDTMRLRVLSGDKALADQTFSSVPTASTYFEDTAIDSGPWLTGASGPVTLTVLMDVTASKADQRFYASLLLANATLNSGGLPADASHDGKVGFADFQRLELNFGGAGDFSQGDFDGNGVVDTDDFRVFYQYFGQTASAATPAEIAMVNAFAGANGVEVPEPGTAALWGLGIFGAMVSRRQRRRR